MTIKALSGAHLKQWFFCVCLAVLGFTGMTACTSIPAGAGSGDTELVTDSDEPELRQRARKRLELALAYFEQGQTTVALDEVKQSIVADPSYAPAYNLRGLIYLRLNDFRIADESFRKSLAINPADSSVIHNLGWLMCQQARYAEAFQFFSQALANPHYGERAKTFRTQGLCQVRAGLSAQAEISLLKSYEFDAGNPVTAYNLALLLFQRADFGRAQFYVRRLNNSELANAESLWLGIKVEQRLKNREATVQLAAQLMKRFPQSHEAAAFQRGAFDE